MGRWKKKRTCMTWKEESYEIRKKVKVVIKININREMEKV
jgi:hypothetical protein